MLAGPHRCGLRRLWSREPDLQDAEQSRHRVLEAGRLGHGPYWRNYEAAFWTSRFTARSPQASARTASRKQRAVSPWVGTHADDVAVDVERLPDRRAEFRVQCPTYQTLTSLLAFT